MSFPATANPSVQLDDETLLEQLRELGKLGADPEAGGRTRIALTDEERAGRDLVVKWMRELDLDVRIDRIGNIFGTLKSASDDGNQRPLRAALATFLGTLGFEVPEFASTEVRNSRGELVGEIVAAA